jgi:Co/Zn/Cd efflux system component
VRAGWLCSRNVDAVGNAAAVVAAGLVAWSGAAWPDLIIAAFIDSLFLHSSRGLSGMQGMIYRKHITREEPEHFMLIYYLC